MTIHWERARLGREAVESSVGFFIRIRIGGIEGVRAFMGIVTKVSSCVGQQKHQEFRL